jgi:hypothetical protein
MKSIKKGGRQRKLFKRIKRGHYILNPYLKIRLAENWYPLNELLTFDGWDHPLEIKEDWDNESTWQIRKDYFDHRIAGFKRGIY